MRIHAAVVRTDQATDLEMLVADRLTYAARASRAIIAQPHEGIERTLERLAEWRDRHAEICRYVAAEAWEERIHQLIGAPWPCDEAGGFVTTWNAASNELKAQGLRIGRGTFGGWDDGDRKLVRAAWCLARHLRPVRTVETGVARGLTSRALLEALEENGSGRLWSIDLPPLIETDLALQTAIAVPTRLRHRWTLVRGSSRRVLPGLITDLGRIDLFVHDSMHTTRNVRFELEHVWPALAPGGAMLIDDVEKNTATAAFLRLHADAHAVISTSEDGNVLIGCVVKRPTDG